jgi:ATP-binding cassette, subfamily B, bacterial PglK
LVEKKLERLGNERLEANSQRFKLAGEAFGGIKELKVLGRESFFTDHYAIHAKKVAETVTVQQTISQVPRFVIEALSFGGILVILLYFLMYKGDVISTLPIIALYAFAGYRLLPALQSIFSSITMLRFNLPVVDDLKANFLGASEFTIEKYFPITSNIPFNEEIRLENVSFFYNDDAAPVIHNMNLSIKKNTNIGIVGKTGSGKTTTVDIILGLLEPQEGVLKVDKVTITNFNVAQWQKNIGYVPQNIFLTDDTIAANIAYGIPHESIDMNLVEQAAKIANIHNFILEDLPFGYHTHVGERGIRLSGGQRQRIGIARALYHDPAVLIMDEATSSLDGVTEEAIIQAIRNLSGNKTIITIAHRLTTLRECDVIYFLEEGKIVESGSFSDLSKNSSRFQNIGKFFDSNNTPFSC